MLVAAVARNRVIGVNGELPWHLPEDLAHFKSITMNKAIVMGRATYDSIGRPLPGRTNVVLTRQNDWSSDGVLVARTPEDALRIAERTNPESNICIIGGGQIYGLFMPMAGRLELTAVDSEPSGDAHFPPWDRAGWLLVADEPQPGPPPHSFQTWVRLSAERDT